MKAVCNTAIRHEWVHQDPLSWCDAKALHNVVAEKMSLTLQTCQNKERKRKVGVLQLCSKHGTATEEIETMETV